MSSLSFSRECRSDSAYVTNWPLVGAVAILGPLVVIGAAVGTAWFYGRWQPGSRFRALTDMRPLIATAGQRGSLTVGLPESVLSAHVESGRLFTASAPTRQASPSETLPETPISPLSISLTRADAMELSALTANIPLPQFTEAELAIRLRGYAREIDLLGTATPTELLLGVAKIDANTVEMSRSVRVSREAVRAIAEHWRQLPIERPALLNHFAQRADLRGLPLLQGAACQSDPKQARLATDASRQLRQALLERGGHFSEMSLSQHSTRHHFWPDQLEPVVSTVIQVLEAETPLIRQELVGRIATLPGSTASAAIARRAVFDLSPEVRRSAIKALKQRPPAEYREQLLAGLRYPWPPAANHAAVALVHVNDREAVGALRELAKLPDPSAPTRSAEGKWATRELAKVNHMRNCLLCHPVSTSESDSLRGVVPSPGSPLPRGYSDSHDGLVVRADVVYLRQDFSFAHEVSDAKPWPTRQRFDYFVRSRELTESEANSFPTGGDYPQRRAVQFALDRLQ